MWLFKHLNFYNGRNLEQKGKTEKKAEREDGNFKINVYEISPSMFLSISKTGFKPKDFANFDISNNLKVNTGDLKLEKLKEKNFFIETGKLPFGNNSTDNANLLGNFSKIVQDNNFTVFSGNFLTLDNNNDTTYKQMMLAYKIMLMCLSKFLGREITLCGRCDTDHQSV